MMKHTMNSIIFCLTVMFFANVFASEVLGDDAAMPSVVVAMTTIPPRFSFIHHTINSWLHQTEIKPISILVFVPKVYKRFKRKSDNDAATETATTVDLLDMTLREKAPHLAQHLDSGTLKLVLLSRDYGPITKLVGILQYRLSNKTLRPDYWVFGDDDVAYTSATLFRYHLRTTMPPPGLTQSALQHTVLTHFSDDVRMIVHVAADKDSLPVVRRVAHIQGVDTVLLPERLLHHQYKLRHSLHPTVFTRLLEFAFNSCPDSFFQDDYVISLILCLANVDVVSAWNNDHVAKHVDGVSKSNSQMHMKPNVYERENSAKACLIANAGKMMELLHSASDEGKENEL